MPHRALMNDTLLSGFATSDAEPSEVTDSNTLPPFLCPLRGGPAGTSTKWSYRVAAFPDSDHGVQQVLVHWWPCKRSNIAPRTVFLFIPGNPGIIDFYDPCLEAIYENDISGHLALLSHAHIGQAPALDSKHDLGDLDPRQYTLQRQLQNVLRILEAVQATFGPSIKIILAAHSIGCWLALQVLKLHPQAVAGTFLLFPVISEIAASPNGLRFSWLFRPPVPYIIARLASIVYIPTILLRMLFPSFSPEQLQALWSFFSSPPVIFATMAMAHDEMMVVGPLDAGVLTQYQHIWIYYAERDDWVGGQKELVLASFKAASRVVHGPPDVPHAFCIRHGEMIGRQCYEWMWEEGLL